MKVIQCFIMNMFVIFPYIPFNFNSVNSDTSYFVPNLTSLFFSLGSLGKGLLILLIFAKN